MKHMHDVEVEPTCAEWVRDRDIALVALHDLKSLIWAVRVCVDMLARGVPEELEGETRLRLTATLDRLIGRVAALADDMMTGLSKTAESQNAAVNTSFDSLAKRKTDS
jgi:hypothetical protein